MALRKTHCPASFVPRTDALIICAPINDSSVSDSTVKVSVCICTYNGATRIGMVIDALATQTQPAETWEVLVINNASTDNTAEVAEDWLRKTVKCAWRVVHEPNAGLLPARRRAAMEARGEIVCFLDDDNIPSPTWVEMVVQAFAARPKAGVIGGKVKPRWEVPPTSLAEAVAPFALAICDRGELPQILTHEWGGVAGAGLCVRCELLRGIFSRNGVQRALGDRKGESTESGGDMAISIIARQMGWECWFDPTLLIEHCLPASRMRKDYLMRLYEGMGHGQASIRRLYDWKARTPLAWGIAAKDAFRWLKGRLAVHRGHPSKLAEDFHDLNLCLMRGRMRHTLFWWW
jgi:glycosyltransferase involved in cell wall biosynthesis